MLAVEVLPVFGDGAPAVWRWSAPLVAQRSEDLVCRVIKGRLGERVGVGWQARACGKCELCRQGLPQLCLEVVDNGTWTPIGGFSSAIVVVLMS